MKKCFRCGRENPDHVVNCTNCGSVKFDHGASNRASHSNDDNWVLLFICPREPEARKLLSKCQAAGIDLLIPDVEEMENAGGDYNAYLTENGLAWIYVHQRDYPAAKKLLPEPPTPSESQAPDSPDRGGKKVIASMEASQTGPIVERLKAAGIPIEVQTVTDEGGLEISELLVEDRNYDQACDEIEAWEDGRLNKQRKKIVCPKCGSENCQPTRHIRLDWINQCQDCGFEFIN